MSICHFPFEKETYKLFHRAINKIGVYTQNMLYSKFAKPIFFNMDPEKAHHLVIDGMSLAGKIPGGLALLEQMYGVKQSSQMAMDVWGLHFHNPVGLAAGLDKNGKAVSAFSSVGFGFIEVGTITPKPQPGNEQPRLFRLPEDHALINRMGFNNEGAEAMAEHLKQAQRKIPLAINIGKNKVTPNEDAEQDYRQCLKTLYEYGDFFVVNISSPNTPDLRSLQHGDELRRLLDAVMEEMELQKAKHNDRKHKPVLVKIAPDVTDTELEYMVQTIVRSGVSGIIATNTTISRDGLVHPNAKETGGLSGKPLFERSSDIIRSIYRMTGGKLPIVGSGGIFSAKDAYEKIRAGASLIEIYTAMIYEGPGLVRTINEGLMQLLAKDGYTHISQAIGSDSK